MNEYHEDSAGAEGDEGRDRARVLHVLTTTGPRTVAELARRPELVGWSEIRLERALTAAWAEGRVSVDTADAFFAV